MIDPLQDFELYGCTQFVHTTAGNTVAPDAFEKLMASMMPTLAQLPQPWKMYMRTFTTKDLQGREFTYMTCMIRNDGRRP